MAKARFNLAFAPALLAVLFWSTSPTAFKIALRHQDPFSLLLGASLVSTLALGVLLLSTGRYKALRSFSGQDLGLSMLLGALNPLAYYLVLFKAYKLLPAHVAQPLNMIWPIVLVLISIPMLFYRLAMLAWALWISFSLINLLKWGWRNYTEPVIWHKIPRKKRKKLGKKTKEEEPPVQK